jgi:hypothetical protein
LKLYNLEANAKRTGVTLGPIPTKSSWLPTKYNLGLLKYWSGSLLGGMILFLNNAPSLTLNVQDTQLSSMIKMI